MSFKEKMSIENAQEFYQETKLEIKCDADWDAQMGAKKTAALEEQTACRKDDLTSIFYHLRQQNATPKKPYRGDLVQITDRFTLLLRPGARLWHVLSKPSVA